MQAAAWGILSQHLSTLQPSGLSTEAPASGEHAAPGPWAASPELLSGIRLENFLGSMSASGKRPTPPIKLDARSGQGRRCGGHSAEALEQSCRGAGRALGARGEPSASAGLQVPSTPFQVNTAQVIARLPRRRAVLAPERASLIPCSQLREGGTTVTPFQQEEETEAAGH